MTDNAENLAPYSLEVKPNPQSAAHWIWTIRLYDKLLQRSDRKYDSEEKARRDAYEAIEKMKHTRGG